MGLRGVSEHCSDYGIGAQTRGSGWVLLCFSSESGLGETWVASW